VFLTPILGVLADRFGRKTVLIPALFLFGTAGYFCTIAALLQNFSFLLFLRFFQGIGAAALGSLNVTIIGDLYSRQTCVKAMGYNASVTSIGTAAYPAIGGTLAGLFGWVYPFLLPIFAIPIGIIAILLLENPEPNETAHFANYLRAAWKGIRNWQVLGVFVASVFTFIILYGAIVTYFPYLPMFAGNSIISGGLISTMSIFTALTATQVGRLTLRFSEKTLILIAFPLYAIALALIAFLPIIWAVIIYPQVPFIPILWSVAIPMIVFGIAQALNMPSLQNLLARIAPSEYRAALMSLNGMVLRLGQTLGPLLMGLVIALQGLNGVYGTAALLALLVVPIVFLTLKGKEKSREKNQPRKSD
jgi:MFS family permease